MAMMHTPLFTLLCAMPLTQATPSAQPPAAKQTTPAANATADADALRGPSVAKAPDRPERSIVQRDFQGRLKKLDENPALAALDTLVRDNLKLLVQYIQAKEAKDTEAINQFQPLVLEKASPYFKRGPLLNEVRPALSDEHAAELRRMVNEYAAAAADDRAGEAVNGPKKENKVGSMLAQGFEGFAAEVRASFDRVINSGGKEFDQFLAKLSLTPEQEGKIRQKAGDLFQKTYGKPTKMQQLQLFSEIYGTLDVEQRHKLAQTIGEENRVKRGSGKK